MNRIVTHCHDGRWYLPKSMPSSIHYHTFCSRWVTQRFTTSRRSTTCVQCRYQIRKLVRKLKGQGALKNAK